VSHASLAHWCLSLSQRQGRFVQGFFTLFVPLRGNLTWRGFRHIQHKHHGENIFTISNLLSFDPSHYKNYINITGNRDLSILGPGLMRSDINPDLTDLISVSMSADGKHRAKSEKLPQTCDICKLRHQKCNSARPSCYYCQMRGLQCKYSTTQAHKVDQSVVRRKSVIPSEARTSPPLPPPQKPLDGAGNARDYRVVHGILMAELVWPSRLILDMVTSINIKYRPLWAWRQKGRKSLAEPLPRKSSKDQSLLHHRIRCSPTNLSPSKSPWSFGFIIWRYSGPKSSGKTRTSCWRPWLQRTENLTILQSYR
jgi:hypothetical protein